MASSSNRTAFNGNDGASTSSAAASRSEFDFSEYDRVEVEQGASVSSVDRESALRILECISSEVTEESLVLISRLLPFLRHVDPVVVSRSITTGTGIFCAIFRATAAQIIENEDLEVWLKNLWLWMVQFKDAVFDVLMGSGRMGPKVLAAKFLETCFELVTSDGNDGGRHDVQGNEEKFHIWLLIQNNVSLNFLPLSFEASKILSLLFDILKSAHMHSGTIVITVINCLASIAKKRPDYYDSILSALLDFDPNSASVECHTASVQYAVRIALLGFLRCTHSSILESREKLLSIIRARYPGEVTEHTIREMEKVASKDANHDATNSGLTPVQELLLTVDALLKEGDKGAESLDLLLSQTDPELMAELIIYTMED